MIFILDFRKTKKRKLFSTQEIFTQQEANFDLLLKNLNL